MQGTDWPRPALGTTCQGSKEESSSSSLIVPPTLNRKHKQENNYSSTYVLTVVVSLSGTAKQLTPQQVAIVLQKGKVEISEELHMFVLHTQLLGRVPVDDLNRRIRVLSVLRVQSQS